MRSDLGRGAGAEVRRDASIHEVEYEESISIPGLWRNGWSKGPDAAKSVAPEFLRRRPRRSVALEERPRRPETARSCLPFVWRRLCVTGRLGQRPAPAMEKYRGHRRH